MHLRGRASLLLSTAALVASFAGSAARAQDATQPPTLTPAEASGQEGLADIVVTAQRRPEGAQRSGVAINVVTGDEISTRGVTSASQLGQLLPAVNIQTQAGASPTFFVRGVGNFAVNGYTDPAIAFNYDGVYVARASSTAGLIYDLDRIEVLKGPQGTLYGRNATSGAINVLPARPRLGETGGNLSASYGNYDAVNVQGALNVAVGDTSALRISGLRSTHDGYLSDGSSDEDLVTARAQILFSPGDDFSIRVATDYAHVGGAGIGASYASGYRYDAAAGRYVFTPAPFDKSVGLLDPATQPYRATRFSGLTGRTFAPLDRGNQLNNDFYGVNAELSLKTSIGSITVIPAFRSGKLDQAFSVSGSNSLLAEKDRQYSVEARLAGDRVLGFADYIVGGFLFRERIEGDYTFNQQALSLFQDFSTRTNANALFARITAHLSQGFRLIGGVRYTNEKKRFNGVGDTVQIICTVRVAGVPSCPTAPMAPTVGRAEDLGFPVPPVGGGPLPIGATGAISQRVVAAIDTGMKADKVNFRAAVEYDLAPRVLAYASFENGFRSGAFSLALGHERYRPEYIDAYTVGVKSRFLGNRAQFNLEAFLWKYRDQQVTHAGLDSRGIQSMFTENVGRSTNKGVEAEFRFLATPTTLLSADLQYLDAKYDSFTFTVPTNGAPPVTGCAASLVSGSLYAIDCSGRQAYQAPKWSLTLGGQQTVRLRGADVVLEANTRYQSRRVVGFDYLAFQTAAPNWTTEARVSVTPAGSPLTISAFVNNLENNRAPVASYSLAVASLYTIVTSPPRTYGVRVAAKF